MKLQRGGRHAVRAAVGAAVVGIDDGAGVGTRDGVQVDGSGVGPGETVGAGEGSGDGAGVGESDGLGEGPAV